jgi:hypothetical protein
VGQEIGQIPLFECSTILACGQIKHRAGILSPPFIEHPKTESYAIGLAYPELGQPKHENDSTHDAGTEQGGYACVYVPLYNIVFSKQGTTPTTAIECQLSRKDDGM